MRAAPLGAGGCNDVTGFGLIDHLVEMTKRLSTCGPIAPRRSCLKEMVEAGIFSSLQPQHLRLQRAVQDGESFRRDPSYALPFDP